MGYTHAEVWTLLREHYPCWLLQARAGKREDRLSTRPPPLREAPWAATAELKADVDAALNAFPLARYWPACRSLFSWRLERRRHRLRDWWKLVAADAGLTVAELRDMEQQIADAVHARLNPQLPQSS